MNALSQPLTNPSSKNNGTTALQICLHLPEEWEESETTEPCQVQHMQALCV